MKRTWFFVGCLLGVLLAWPEASRAQMFGSRMRQGAFGAASPTNSQPAANSGATFRGDERFLRKNRQPGKFIGNDAESKREFVGKQTSGSTAIVPPATDGLHIDRGPQVNNTSASTVNRATGMYEPKLAIGFELPTQMAGEVNAALTHRLQTTPGLPPSNRIAVSLEGRTAVLRGEVASERDRSLVEKLILFEPGVSSVRNDLKVKSPSPAKQPPTSKPESSPSPSDHPMPAAAK